MHPNFTMRLVPVLVFATLLTAPAFAQTQYADSSGGFIALYGLTLGQSGGVNQRAVDAAIGYRFASGTDASLRAVRRIGFSTTTALGTTVGTTRPIGAGFSARLEGSVLASQTTGTTRSAADGTLLDAPIPVRIRALRGDVTASVSRPLRLVGSLRLHPTLGLYVRTGTERVTLDGEPADRFVPFAESRAGVHVALPLSFRLFGQTASVEAAMRFAPSHGFSFEVPGDASFSPGGGAYAGGGLRMNF